MFLDWIPKIKYLSNYSNSLLLQHWILLIFSEVTQPCDVGTHSNIFEAGLKSFEYWCNQVKLFMSSVCTSHIPNLLSASAKIRFFHK